MWNNSFKEDTQNYLDSLIDYWEQESRIYGIENVDIFELFNKFIADEGINKIERGILFDKFIVYASEVRKEYKEAGIEFKW